MPILYAAGALTVVKLARGPTAHPRILAAGMVGALVVFVAGVLHAALRRAAPFAGSLALDRFHDLHDRVTNALAFSTIPAADRTPLMEAAINDGAASADRLSPRRAVPLRLPRDLPAALALAAATVALGSMEIPIIRLIPPPAHRVEALAVSEDDAELFRKMSDELLASTTQPEALAGARKFNQIVEDLAERRLDRREVFRRLDELERSLKGSIDPAALDDALDGIAKELDKNPMSKPVGTALGEKRLAEAEQAMRDLARKVETAKKGVDAAKLESLRRALEKSSETVQKGSEQERQQLEERRKRLLEKKEKQGLSSAEQQELDRTERRLEHLDREKSDQAAQSQQMSGLDKDLAKAASDLMKDLGMSSKDLQKSAEDINRTASQKMSDQQKQELRRRIEEIRQILRQEGQGGRDRLRRMMAFGQRARGNGQSRGQGQGSRGSGRGQPGGNDRGQGQGDGSGGTELTLGLGKPGSGPGVNIGSGGVTPGASGAKTGGAGQGGDEWGAGHDPNLQGAATKLKGQTQDVTASANDTGEGSASSEVIYGAAQRGFTGHGYQKVYAEYENVAEETLAKDEIPPGYRFYVRRYFQLIRPRD